MFLPAWADVRVVYGHPFETLDAEATRSRVEDFFAQRIDRDAALSEWRVVHIYFGPREGRLGPTSPDWLAVFRSGDVAVYQAP